MKKKWLLTGCAVGISGAMMLATGLTAFAGASGYEDYKSALKNTAQTMESVTIQAEAILKDNGTLLSRAQSDLKADLKTETVSGTVQLSGRAGSQNLSLYSQTDGQIWKSDASDTYYLKQARAEKKDQTAEKEAPDDSWLSGQEETVIDALIGNLKNEMTSATASDGTKNISLQLNNAQIPAVVQALAPVVFKHLADPAEQDDHADSGITAAENDPEELLQQSLLNVKDIALTEGVQIQSLSLKAVLNPANEIQRQQMDITFSGLDVKGVSHTITASLDVQLSSLNGTTPDSVNLAGKPVVQVKDDHEDGQHE